MVIGGAALLVALLVGVFMFTSRPTWALVYGGLNESDKFGVVSEIQAMGIPVRYDGQGAVMVPQDRVAEVRMRLAGANKQPKGAHLGIEGYDRMNMLSTPAVERNRIRALLEHELSRSIETMEGIRSAIVHINLGERSLFANQTKPASASIKVTEMEGAQLSQDQGRAIAMLVANAVENLNVKDVTVVNQSLEFVFNGPDMDNARSAAGTKLEIEDEVAQRRSRQLTQVLEGVFGAGAVYVLVHPNVVLDEEQRQRVTRTPADEATERQQVREQMRGANGQPPAGVAGAGSNMIGAAPGTPDGAGSASGEDYMRTQTSENRPLNEESVSLVKATGELRGLMINVVADQARVDTPEKVEQLRSIVAGEVRNQEDQQAFQTNVTVVPFDTSGRQQAQAEASAAQNQARIQQLLSVLPIVALLAVALIVMKQLSKLGASMSPPLVPATAGGPMPAFPPDGGFGTAEPGRPAIAAGNGGAESSANLQSSIAAAMGTNAPAIGSGNENLPVRMDGESDEEHEERVKVALIRDRIDLPLEQIKRLADEKPQMVGMLIKSMLLEDR
jgi:flagellar M-ring protein FliF